MIRQLSKPLGRRDVLALLRATITAMVVVGCTSKKPSSAQASKPAVAASTTKATLPNCIVSPKQTEGPYFVDEKLNRSDIRLDPADRMVTGGLSLQLTLRVSEVGNTSCTPVAGSIVDIWHCDALGVYSDVTTEVLILSAKSFYVAIKLPMLMVLCSLQLFILAGIKVEQSTFTLKFARLVIQSKVTSLRRSYTLMTQLAIAFTHKCLIRVKGNVQKLTSKTEYFNAVETN